MKTHVAIFPLLCALGLLAGCSKDRGSSEERFAKLEAENAEMRQKLKSLGEDVRSLERRADEVEMQNRTLEKMLAVAEEDLRSRLKEMVQQEVGAGGGRGGPFAQRGVRPAVLPRPYLGFDGETNSPEAAQKLGLAVKTEPGVLVSEVIEGAPADLGGLRKADLLQSINGNPVKSREDLIAAFGDMKPGQECQLSVLRGEEQVKLSVKVGAR